MGKKIFPCMKGVVVIDVVGWSLVFKDGKDVISITPELSFKKKLKPSSVRTG